MVPGDAAPVHPGRTIRGFAGLVALALLTLPGLSAARTEAGAYRVWTWKGPRVLAAAPTPPGAEVAGPESLGDTGDPEPITPVEQDAPWESLLVEAAPSEAPAEGGAAPPDGDASLGAVLVEPDGTPLPAKAATLAPAATPPAPAGPAPPTLETARVPAPAVTHPAPAAPSVEVPAEREYLRRILIRYAQEQGLPADVVMALAWVESSWRARPVSHAGAMGVMQLMPTTVEFTSHKLLDLDHRLDPDDATQNVRMGTRFLRHLLDRMGGDLRQALIAYNQGITSLKKRGPYGESAAYADRILALRSSFGSR